MRRNAAALPNKITFSTLMAALCQAGEMKSAFDLFEEMISVDRINPDNVTYNILVNGFCRRGLPDKAAQIISFMKAHNCPPNTVNYTTLMDGLCKAGRLEEAMEILAAMKKDARESAPDAVGYTTLISCLCRVGRVDEAVDLLKEMEEGCGLDSVACNVVISGLCREGRTVEAAEMLGRWSGERKRVNRASYRILLNRLLEDGEMERVGELLRVMLEGRVLPHFAASNEMLVKLCDQGKAAEVVMTLQGLVVAGFVPSVGTWLRLVQFFCRERKLSQSLYLVDCLAVSGDAVDLDPG